MVLLFQTVHFVKVKIFFLDDYTLEDIKKAFPDEEVKVASDAIMLKNLLADWHNIKCERSKAIYTWQSNASYTK